MEQAKKLNVLSKITKIKGIFLVLLGIVHIIGSYFEYGKIKSEMSKDLSHNYMTWFIALGYFLMFMGSIDLLTYKGLKQKMIWVWKISTATSVFTIIAGLTGTIAFINSPSPPNLILLSGIISIIALLSSKKEFYQTN